MDRALIALKNAHEMLITTSSGTYLHMGFCAIGRFGKWEQDDEIYSYGLYNSSELLPCRGVLVADGFVEPIGIVDKPIIVYLDIKVSSISDDGEAAKEFKKIVGFASSKKVKITGLSLRTTGDRESKITITGDTSVVVNLRNPIIKLRMPPERLDEWGLSSVKEWLVF